MSRQVSSSLFDVRIRVTVPKFLLLVAAFITLAAGCADDSSTVRETGPERQAPHCPNDETLSCVEKMGKVVKCTCSSRDELRRIMEPGKR